MARKARSQVKSAAPAKQKTQEEHSESLDRDLSANRTVIYNLTSSPDDWNLSIENLSLTFHGKPILQDTQLHLIYGERYALVGSNGCGKTTLLRTLASPEFKYPHNFDVFFLQYEWPANDDTPLSAVTHDLDEEVARIEDEIDLLMRADEVDEDMIEMLNARLDNLSPETAEARASRILVGLGFTHQEMHEKKCRELSGGWRMRVSLARALFVQPALLLLDSPTSHLDLGSVLWLGEALRAYTGTIVLTSHSADFLEDVATQVILMREKRLNAFSGSYESYLRQRDSLDASTARLYQRQQRQIEKVRSFIQKYGQSSKQMARQAQSRQKALDRMMDTAITAQLLADTPVEIMFVQPRKMPPPLVAFRDVAFKYPGMERYLYDNVNLGIHPGDVVFVVGGNGTGKSTLMKLVRGILEPCEGMIRMQPQCRVAFYHQHVRDELPGDVSPLDYFKKKYPSITDEQAHRKSLGRFGITGESQTTQIDHLSDGQRVRIALAVIAQEEPTLILLDEPTNGMDTATIDGLARALRKFEGAALIVSHDFRLMQQVAEGLEPGDFKHVNIWEVVDNSIQIWKDSIQDYKAKLLEAVMVDVGGV